MIAPFVTPEADAPVVSDVIDSPVGKLLLTGDGTALTGVYFLDAGDAGDAGDPGPAGADAHRSPGSFTEVRAQLAAYFGGELEEFSVPLAPSGTPFQLAVWAELIRIPYGVTASYGDIARALGKSPVASRAVGAANGRNPIPVIVPCHRVIGADGGLTGYGGGLERKLTLLRIEGSAGLW
jgi:methylated-DNA-[protein]-cysteine S-methyltransferase